MDVSQFSEFKTGKLVPIMTSVGPDHAFVPDALPPRWSMAERLWPLLVKAHACVARLDGIGQTLPHLRLLLRPLQRREAMSSSALEGTYTTPSEMLLFEVERKHRGAPAAKTDRRAPTDNRTNAWREVFNYYTALRRGHQWLAKGRPLDTESVLLLHRTLLKNVRGKDPHPGRFRDVQVFVGAGRRFAPPPPEELDRPLEALVAYLGQEDTDLDPLVRAYCVHYQFEAIHPFVDGNGRVGRLLLSLSISSWLRLSDPWLYMSPYFDRHRETYLQRLFRVSTAGEWDEWIEFCLEGTVTQAEDAIRRCAALQQVRKDYVERVGQESTRMHVIVDMLFDMPLLRIVDLQHELDVSYPTAKSDVEKLVSAKILEPLEATRPRAFVATQISEIAFGDNI